MRAYYYDWQTDAELPFESEEGCCSSCVGDIEDGYGGDISGCCCKHQKEAEDRGLTEL